MAFAPFHTRFPEIAEEETRSVMVLDRKSLSAGKLEFSEMYTFIDSYCEDRKCDCRTVFINVWSEKQEKIIATIRYGWESVDYYAKWMHGSRKEARMMAGVSLDISSPESDQAREALERFMELLQDKEYEARLRRHYRMFRRAVDKGSRLTFTRKPARNAPCPCGSGRKYKGCCARSRAA